MAGGLGNLVARVLTLAQNTDFEVAKNFHNKVLQTLSETSQKNVNTSLENFDFAGALENISKVIHYCDRYIEEQRPWEESKQQKEVMGDLLLAISHIAELLQPFLPETSGKIIQQLQQGKGDPIFPRISS